MWKCFSLVILKIVLIGLLFTQSLIAKELSILCLGDSITYGAPGDPNQPSPGGYRDYLYKALQYNGHSVTMLGPLNTNSSDYLKYFHAEYHAGFGGYRIDNIDDNLDGNKPPWPGNQGGYWLTGIKGKRAAIYPDIILLMAGTNDILQNVDLTTMTNRLNHLVGKLVTLRPKTKLIISMIPPVFSQQHAKRVEQYNVTIYQMVQWYQQNGFSVSLMDNYHYYLDKSWGFPDHVHPSLTIYNMMGYGWAQSVLQVISRHQGIFGKI